MSWSFIFFGLLGSFCGYCSGSVAPCPKKIRVGTTSSPWRSGVSKGQPSPYSGSDTPAKAGRVAPLRLFSFFLIFATVLAACHSQPDMSTTIPPAAHQTEKFRLSATPGTADGYPVTFDEESCFLNSDGGGFPLPAGHYLEESWQGSGIIWAVGDEWQAVPDSLQVRWFSFAEDKFYEGHFPLPQERLHALLKQGLWNGHQQQQITYDDLTVVVAPGGLVVVWLTAGSSDRVLVGHYYAQEISDDYNAIRPGDDRAADVREARSNLSAAVQEEIKRGPVTSRKWEAYLRTYPWQLAFSQPVVLTNYSARYVNAEATSSPVTRDLTAFVQRMLAPTAKPVPSACYLHGTAEHGTRYVVQVEDFDEAETQAAFQDLHQLSPGSPITLLFTIDKPFQKVTLTLKNERKEIPLTLSKAEMLSED